MQAGNVKNKKKYSKRKAQKIHEMSENWMSYLEKSKKIKVHILTHGTRPKKLPYQKLIQLTFSGFFL